MGKRKGDRQPAMWVTALIATLWAIMRIVGRGSGMSPSRDALVAINREGHAR